MNYFYAPPQQIASDTLEITGEEARHLSQVMRMRPGEALRVADGAGMMYDATIESIAKDLVRCSITAARPREHESACRVTLAVALVKNFSNYDFLVEKATEIGVAAFVPLLTERTIPRHAKEYRWQKIALSAMKQSERCLLPRIYPLTSLADFVGRAPASALKLIPHELHRDVSIRGAARPAEEALVCIGPEGGFSDQEIALAQAAGFAPVTLGARRLKTETAAIVAAAMLLGDE